MIQGEKNNAEKTNDATFWKEEGGRLNTQTDKLILNLERESKREKERERIKVKEQCCFALVTILRGCIIGEGGSPTYCPLPLPKLGSH